MTIRCTISNQIAEVVMHHPPVNAITVGDTWKIHDTFKELAERSAREDIRAIILTADTLEETIGLSHRILVMCEGRVTGEIPGRGATQERIMQLATQRESMTAT